MKKCVWNHTVVLRFLSGDLNPRDRADFLVHLRSCADCRATLEQEQALSNVLKRSRPLYTASPALRERVMALVEQRRGSNSVRTRLLALIPQTVPLWRLLPVPAAIIVAVLLFSNMDREARAASYVDTAARAHRAYEAGGMAVELRTESPDELKAWVGRKAHCEVQLPVLPVPPGRQNVYRLVGASLLPYRKHQAAIVIYEANNERVSLIVAPSNTAAVAGGDVSRAQSLVLHFFRVDNSLRVVTWSSHGTAYALVSSFSVAADRACLVCHQQMTDRSLFGTGDKRHWLEHPRRVGN